MGATVTFVMRISLLAALLCAALAWSGGRPPSALSAGLEAIVAGDGHTCALKDGGALCWGDNERGQLGIECTEIVCGSVAPVVPTGMANGIEVISAGGLHTCAIQAGGLWCWGYNESGQLGSDPSGTFCTIYNNGHPTFLHCSRTPLAVPGMESGVTAIGAGDAHTCALKDGGVWCWGANTHGQLGDNSTVDRSIPVAVVGMGSGVSAISAGGAHTCALKDGAVWCWGDNARGELGDGMTADSAVPVAVTGLPGAVSAVDAGGSHTCAIEGGAAWCWGANDDGRLGDGTVVDSAVPVAVSGFASGVSAISSGGSSTCAVKDGGAWCWGDNYYGQLGNNNGTVDSSLSVAVIGLASGVSAIAAGSAHACALDPRGVWCWGSNSNGQLGSSPPYGQLSRVPVAVPELTDSDGDGCNDHGEALLSPQTDPQDPWDFYSVPVPALFAAPDPLVVFKNGAVTASDAQAIFAYFKKGARAGTLEYEQDLNGNGIKDGIEYDRSILGPGSGPPDGTVTAQDAQLAFAQFKLGYHC